jgi:hypothetical protein
MIARTIQHGFLLQKNFLIRLSLAIEDEMTHQCDPEFDRLCDSILEINNNIQSVVVINKLGKPVSRSARPRYAKQFPDKSEILFMQCVLEISMGRDFDDQYGPINYHVSERANITMLTFPIDDHVIVITTNKNIGPISLAKKIVSITSQYKCSPMLNNR